MFEWPSFKVQWICPHCGNRMKKEGVWGRRCRGRGLWEFEF
jgi:tRNA(Ile2) C34 agmatinyltransferase TiaS